MQAIWLAADDIGRTIYGKPQLRDSPLHHSISNTGSLSNRCGGAGSDWH